MLNKKTRILAGVGIAIVMSSFVGCEMPNSQKDDARSEGRQLDDKNITAGVKKSMDAEPAYKLNGVNVKTFAGVVELTGFVDIPGQKVRAQEIAEHTGGVREVINGIFVKPPMPSETSRPSQDTRIYAEPQNVNAPAK